MRNSEKRARFGKDGRGWRNEGIARIFAWGALNSAGTVIVRRLNEASGHEHALVCINICVGGSIHRESWSLLKTALFALAERTVSFLHATKGNIYRHSSVEKISLPFRNEREGDGRSLVSDREDVFIIFDKKIVLDKSSSKVNIRNFTRTWKYKNIVSIFVYRVSLFKL